MAKKVRKSSGRLKPAEIAELFDRFAAAVEEFLTVRGPVVSAAID